MTEEPISFGRQRDEFRRSPGIGLECIEGLARRQIRELERLGISNVQNLAAANPIILLLRTPFSIAQIRDWIEQAQLIRAVGLDKADHLRAVGVRKLTELINYANHSDSAIAYQITRILFGNDGLMAGDNSALSLLAAVLTDDLAYRRLALLDSEALGLMVEAIEISKEDAFSLRYERLSIMRRFTEQSVLTFPLSIVTLIGSAFEFWVNLGHTTQTLMSMLVMSALAQGTPATQQVQVLPQDLRPLVVCFLGAGIFVTLAVCIYSGFVARKPSAKAAEAVKSILSFAFGIVASSLSGL